MTRPRGRPSQGTGVSRDEILAAALNLLDEGAQGLTMRALASRLGVTPMSLYHHVEDRNGLLRALSDRVYAEVLEGKGERASHQEEVRAILINYYEAIRRHPQLTLAIWAAPEAFAGVTRQITDHLTALLSEVTTEPCLWRDILIDHAHGSGLPISQAYGGLDQTEIMREQYLQALDRLLGCLAGAAM